VAIGETDPVWRGELINRRLPTLKKAYPRGRGEPKEGRRELQGERIAWWIKGAELNTTLGKRENPP